MPTSEDNQSTGERTLIDDDMAGAIAAVLFDDALPDVTPSRVGPSEGGRPTDLGGALFPQSEPNEAASEVVVDLTDDALVVQADTASRYVPAVRPEAPAPSLFPAKAPQAKVAVSGQSLFAPKKSTPTPTPSHRSLFGNGDTSSASQPKAATILPGAAAATGVAFVPAPESDDSDRLRLIAGLAVSVVVLLGGFIAFLATRDGSALIEAEVQLIPATSVTNTVPTTPESASTAAPTSASTSTTAELTTEPTTTPTTAAPLATAPPTTRRPATTRQPATTRPPATPPPTTAQPATLPTIDGLEEPAWKTTTTAAPTTQAPVTAAPTTAAPATQAPATEQP